MYITAIALIGIICLLTVSAETEQPSWQIDMVASQKVLDQGKQAMERILSQSISVSDDNCYRALAPQFQEACASLHSQSKFRLALAFYNCQRRESGFSELRCTPKDTIEQCAERMGSESNAYQTVVLLTHQVENMCYFVHSSQFQKQTSETINNLASASFRMTHYLHDMNEAQDLMLGQIRRTLAEQMKAGREYERMRVNMEKLRDMEQDHHQRTEQQHNTIQSLTEETSQHVQTGLKMSALIVEKNEEMQKSLDSHFQNMLQKQEELSLSMEDSLKLSASIHQQQQLFSQQMDSLYRKQQVLEEAMAESQEKQSQLLQGQAEMKRAHDAIFQTTQLINQGITESASMLQVFAENSARQHEALRSTVDETHSRALDIHKNTQLSMELSTTLIQNLNELREFVGDNFGVVVEHLQVMLRALSRIEFRTGVLVLLLYYVGAFFVTAILPCFIARLRKARAPLMAVIIMAFFLEPVLVFWKGIWNVYLMRLCAVSLGFLLVQWSWTSYSTEPKHCASCERMEPMFASFMEQWQSMQKQKEALDYIEDFDHCAKHEEHERSFKQKTLFELVSPIKLEKSNNSIVAAGPRMLDDSARAMECEEHSRGSIQTVIPQFFTRRAQ